MSAEFPVLGFDVALPSLGKLEVPLDEDIPRIAIRPCWFDKTVVLPDYPPIGR
jgi:hypothetical protein